MAVDWDRKVLEPLMDRFGETVLYSPTKAPQFSLPSAVFDEGHIGVDLGDDGPVASDVSPVLGVRLALFPAGLEPRQNDRFTLADGRTYIVRDPQLDGHGHAKLLCNLVKHAP